MSAIASAAVRYLLALPRHVQLLIGGVVLALLVVWGVYHHGEAVGARKVEVAARADSVTHQRTVVAVAVQKSDSGVVASRVAVARSTNGRQHTRDVVDALRDSTPPAVIEVVRAQLVQDSTTIAVQAATIVAQLDERAARVNLDTLQEHQVIAGSEPPPGGRSLTDVVKDVAVVAVIVEVVRLVLHLLGR